MCNMEEGYKIVCDGLKMVIQGMEILQCNYSKAIEKQTAMTLDKSKMTNEENLKYREEVRKILIEKSRKGKGEEIRILLKKFNVEKYSDLPEELLPEFRLLALRI